MRYRDAREHLLDALEVMRRERAYAEAQRGAPAPGSADDFAEKTLRALEVVLVDANGAPRHFPAAVMPCAHLSDADIANLCEMRGIDYTQSANEPTYSLSARQLRSLLVEAQVASDATLHAHIKQSLTRSQQGFVMNAYRYSAGQQLRLPKSSRPNQAKQA